jgi:hypothetical protein
MIELIKDYFKETIRLIDSDLSYDGLVFDNDLTADHNLDYTYKMVLGTMSINRPDTAISSQIPIDITIYRVSNSDKLEEDFSNLYCKAIDITSLAMNQTRIAQTGYLKSVLARSIEPAPILNNDNSLQFTLKFIVELAYKYKL